MCEEEEWDVRASAKTAKKRSVPSRVVQMLVSRGILRPGMRVLDYGCGRPPCIDVEYLRSVGIDAYGWDINWFPDTSVLIPNHYDVVMVNFVLNAVLPRTREKIMKHVISLAKKGGLVIVSVRSAKDRTLRCVERYEDGCITSTGTFQKGYTREELVDFLSRFLKDVKVLFSDDRRIVAVGRVEK